MTMLDARELKEVARAWARAFALEGGGIGEEAVSVGAANVAPAFGVAGDAQPGEEEAVSVGAAAADVAPAFGVAGDARRRESSRVIRVGFLSGHLGDHPVGHHIGTALRLLDRARFRVVCLPTQKLQQRGEEEDPTLSRNRASCDEWVAVDPALPARAAAAVVRAAGVDALVAVDGYDVGHRMDVLMQRPAPACVSFFGFLGTLGSAEAVDGVVADAEAVPEGGEAERGLVEGRVLRHPTTFFVTDYQTLHPELAGGRRGDGWAEMRLGGGGGEGIGAPPPFAFCSFSQLFKVAPATFDAWMRILRRSEGSVLVLANYPPVGRRGLEARLDEVDEIGGPSLRGRVRFLDLLPRDEHLVAKRRLCALGLDTPGYNGHTSTADLLWAGVPVLTYAGDGAGFAGRAARSLVKAAGAPGVFYGARSLEEYEEAAVAVWRAWMGKGEEGGEGEELRWRPGPGETLFDREAWVRGFEGLLEGVVGKG
jgi:predicted O-linked N-acetylglucosamine transferase (SPINDLY family)